MPSAPAPDVPVQLSLFDAASVSPPATPMPTAPSSWPVSQGLATPESSSAPPRSSSPGAAREPADTRAREIHFGEHRVTYALRRGRRRSIGLVIGPDGLTVSAPRWTGAGEIEAALRAKSAWILRKLQEQRERSRRLEAARVEWRDGTSIPFLGEPVIVVLDRRVTGQELRSADDTLPGVPRLTLHLGLPQDAQPLQIRDAVQSWLQRQARRIFEERIAIYAERLSVRVRRLAISAAATRWGSASADGSIRLNWRLVHFGLPVIDYVVTHELAHLHEMNHGPAFWDVVRAALPGFEAARGALRTELLPVFE